MKKVFSNIVEAVKSTVKNKMDYLTVQKSDVEMVVENAEVMQSGQKRKGEDGLSLAMVGKLKEKKQLQSTEEAQLDKQGPCMALVQVDHPSTSLEKGKRVASNAVFSCEEVKTITTRMEHLLAQKSDVETAVVHAEIQPGKKRKREVEWWLAMIEQKETELERIEAQLEKQGPCKKLKYQIASKAREVDELIQQGKFTTGVVLDHHPVLEIVETSLVGSRCAENIEMILNWLKEDGVFAIGVHGMGGVGKTTLLKTIHNRLLQVSDFKRQVYWVTASRDCSLLRLQTAIGKCLGLENIGEEDDERRKSSIFHRLSQLKKSVLIIDDMWSHYATDKMGIPLGSCKIVITSRSLEVCQKFGCQRLIKVVPLLNEDAWALFVKKSGIVPNNFTVIARGIVKQCAGLPLALITMGCCMTGVTDVHQWENALYELKKPERRQDHDMDDEVFRILQFSYDSLKDESTKQCLLSCVLFPEDSVIRPVNLIDLWITEGLLDDIEGWENKANKGHTILNRLESSSLLESATGYWDYERCVRMHDLIRDMVIVLAQHGAFCMTKARLQLNKVPEHKQWTCDLVKVSLSHNKIEEIPCGMSPETPKLRVLILSRNPLKEIPESFFVHMKALQMLDLSDTYINRLPDTVSDLEDLKGLFLKGCLFLTRVPSLVKLTKLMALDLTQTDCFEGGFEGLERLKCLEKLHYHSPWSELDVLRFNNLMLSGQLKLYNILLGSVPKSFYSDRDCDCEKEVGIFGQRDMTPVLLPSTIQSLVIEESGIEGQRSLEEALPSLKHATDLRFLKLRRCEGLECVFTSSASREASSNYPLWSLQLHDLDNITRIAKNGLYPSFSNLKILTISKCPKIRVVFPSMLPQQQQIILPCLEILVVHSCEEVEEIIESNKESSSVQTAGCITDAAFPNLHALFFLELPKLGSIYSMQLHLCPLLEAIGIEDCPEIEGIFGDAMSEDRIDGKNLGSTFKVNPRLALPNLRDLRLARLSKLGSILPLQLHLCTSLEEIQIEDCPKLESISEEVREIFEGNRKSKSSKTVDQRVNVTNFNPTVTLPNFWLLRLINLPKLSGIYPLKLHLNISEIGDCPKIEKVVRDPIIDTELVFDLPSLRKLELSCLPELRNMHQMRLHLSTSLQTLEIKECPKLEGIFTNPTGVVKPILALPTLYMLDLEGLPNLNSIYRGLLRCPQLGFYRITKECPQLKMLSLSSRLICDSSPMVASFPTQSEDPEWWEPLQRDHPDDVIPLSDYIQQARRLSTMPQE